MPQSNTAKFILRLLDSFKTNEEKIAIVDQNGQRQTTYGELYMMACRVAGYLHQKNYPPHSFIGICLPASAEYVAAEIGIWLAGHAIVPMGDQFPKDRIDAIMQHSEAPLLVDGKVVQTMMRTEPATHYVLPKEEDISVLFYTSGSTGVPKGVMADFASYRISPTDERIIDEEQITVMGITSPMYFVVSKQLYAILVKGGTADIAPTEVMKDLRLLEAWITKQRIEFVFMPPSLLAHFHNQSPHLKVVMAAAERLSGIASADYKIYNLYGQTETGGAFFSFFVDKKYDNTPIGKPDSDVEYCIMDAAGSPVATGEEGELCVRGPFATGYYKEPALTAQLFRGGWLHTGDMVRQLPDGNVVYVNRLDWMVKVNGQRVEPGEVEAVVKQVDGVEDAIVKGFTTKDRQFLCAYYIASENVTEDTIREYLLSKLPAYMVPVFFVRMDSFPLLPNGKTDRKSLLSPVDTGTQARPPYAEPSNHTERQLCKAFEKALGIGRIGIDDDFLELGGDSIRVMEVQTLCPELTLSSRMIYENRTPKKIAKACAHKEQVVYNLQNDYPLSQTQLGIYVECMARQGEVAYNNGMLFQLNSSIDADRLSKACETVVEAHPYIKTRLFVDSHGNPRQLRNDAEPYHQDVETLTLQAFEKLKPELIRPFDLLNDRLFRIRILKTPEAQYLFIDFHHIIFDGLSFNIFLQDLKDAYGQQQIKREEFTGYEIVLEEESLRKTEAYTSARQWYMEKFGSLKISSLPIPEKKEPKIAFGQEHLKLAVEYNQLLEAAAFWGVTPNVLTTTVFGYLLGVNTHAQESLFATIFSGRQDLKTQRTMAMLVKTFPVYTKWNQDTTISELLQTTKQQLMGSMSNSLFSFAEVKAMNNAINSHILFAYQGDLKQSDNDFFSYQPLMENATGEDMAFEILRNGTQLILHTEYHSNQYTQSFIQRLMHCYETILEGFLHYKSEDKRLCELPILTDDEQQAIIALGTGNQLDYDKSETIVDLFHRQATLSPKNIAVVDEISEITYAELDRKSDLLALAFRKAGVSTDTFVAIMLPRRKEFLIAVFAVFKAGGAYIPLDSDYPKERLSYMLNDSEAHLLVTTSTLLKDCQTEQYYPRGKHLLMDDFDFNEPSDEPVNYAKPSALAYMIYTSGTTGKPKGVTITHEAMMNFIVWLKNIEELKAGEQCAIHTNFVFDGSLFDLYPPLIAGATLHVLSSSLRMDPQGMYRYFIDHHIAGLLLTTQIGMMMMSDYELPLRFLMVGGERLTSFRVPLSMKLYNCYGPTEFTVCSSFFQVDSGKEYHTIPIGRPVPNTLSVVVDRAGRLVPQGAVGELCLTGSQLSGGYWKQERLTKESFVDCSFLNGRKMYRTGDLVRWNEDGQLEYIGRIDNQVKLNGYRIELEEIENKMIRCPGVASAAAIVSQQDHVEYIIGYYTSEGNQELPHIREALAAALPGYMVPSQLVRIDQMPLTPNGKVDRKALPVPDMTSEKRVAPETEMERQVLELTTGLLNTTQPSVTDNLLHWGLSSLAVMRLSALLQRRFNVYVKMAEIMKRPTVRAIAAMLTEASAHALPVFERRASYPLMENQRGLYLEWKKNPDTTQYNIPFVYGFEGTDAARMVNALKQVVDAHPYLKSRLTEVNGEVVLQRHDEDEADVIVSELAEEPGKAYFQKRVRPFHLTGDPLFRIEVLKTPRKTYLFLDVHHIIFDGLSIEIFMRDFQRAYDRHDLTAESFQAFDYMLYEQRQQDHERTEQAEKWTDRLLADAQVLTYPNASKPDGRAIAFVRHAIAKQEIDTFCSKGRVTVNSYMHAAFATAMRRISGVQRPVYLTVNNGREAGAELMQCIGMFVRTLPFVNTCHETSNLSTKAYVQETQQLLQESYRMDYYPLTAVVERHQIHPEIMFAYQGGLQGGKIPGQVEQISVELDKAKFPLSFVVNEEADTYSFVLEYDGLRYDRQQMQQLLSAVCMAARRLAVVDTVEQVELVSEDEKLSLLTLGSGLTLDYNRSLTFVSLFKEQVAQVPDAIAVVDTQSSITYQELDCQSDILAIKLKDLGVTEGSFVSIMLPRTKAFMVAVIAIFKAGGAYVPLDSDMPEDRLHFMLKDSQTTVLLTTRDWLSKIQPFQDIPVLMIEDIDWTTPSVAIDDSCPTSLAYMIYTSGSTGNPKGVTVTHEAMMNFIVWLKETEELKAGEQCAIHTNFVFDGSLFDLYPPLISGATLHILSTSLRMDLHGMYRYFTDHHIVGLLLTTQMGMMMMNNYELPLRFLMVGGEKLTGFHIPPSMKLYNCYGPTEFAVCSAFHQVDRLRTYDNIPIGRPVPNTLSVVVDDKGHLLPRGLAGELCLIGRQMARGYWNRPELTSEYFTDCPFMAGEKMYHTRDLVRWNDEGELEYLGRMDAQLKIRGYRVELGDIEHQMTAFPEVTSAAVIARQEQQAQYLTGYFTAAKPVDPERIREQLKRQLPAYMIPRFLIQLPTMPVNINGKIDRQRLMDDQPLPLQPSQGAIAPTTRNEKTLLDLARQVLKTDGFGVTDDLTLSGLTSLSAIRLADQANRQGLYVKVNDILRHKTIRNILIHEQSIGTWENEYDASKPVIVLIQGFTSYERLTPLISKLSKHYSVFVIEPISDHFEDLFNEEKQSSQNVAEFYLDYLEAVLPPDTSVAMFIGHSFGGELAYRCSVLWSKRTSTMPKVCLFDTFAHVTSIVKEVPIPDVKGLTPDEESDIEELKEWNRHLLQMQALKDDSDLPAYDGDVLYFKAEELSLQLKNIYINVQEFAQKRQEDLNSWSTLAPHLCINSVAAGHLTMLDEQFCDNYIEKIDDIVLPSNS